MNDMFSADELEACLKVRLALRYIYTCRAGANKTKKKCLPSVFEACPRFSDHAMRNLRTYRATPMKS